MKKWEPGRSSRCRSAAIAWLTLAVAASGCAGLSYPEEPPPRAAEPQSAAPTPAAGTNAWISHSRNGHEALRLGQLEIAEESFVAALTAASKLRPGDARQRAALGNLVRLAAMYQRGQRFEDAARLTAIVLAESRAGRRPDFETTVPVLLTQGRHLERSGRRADAVVLYEFAASLEPPRGAVTATQLELRRRLANAYVASQRLEEAAPLLESLLAGAEQRHGPESPATAQLWADLARLRVAQQDYPAAEQSYLRAVELRAAIAPASLELARLENELAQFYLGRQRHREAEPLARKALERLEELGDPGAALAATLDTLATAEAGMGELDAAERHYRRAIEEREKADPAARRELLSVLENYADLLRSSDRTSEAVAIEARIALELQRDASQSE